MADFSVCLTSVDQVKEFVSAACHCPCEVDVCCGRYVVNAKSIMGLFSLDLSGPVEVAVHGEALQKEAFRADVAAFLAQPPQKMV